MADRPTDLDVLTLRPSKRKWLLVTLGSATFTAIGVAMLASDNPWPGLFSIAFFGPARSSAHGRSCREAPTCDSAPTAS